MAAKMMTTVGLEPTIFGSEDRRLIHWATRPLWQPLLRYKLEMLCSQLSQFCHLAFLEIVTQSRQYIIWSCTLGTWRRWSSG